ncbi:unnamed protein product [Pelagomonas calceolata]|uniref:RING-type domain-containing protein n=1 Tax=Pelagomonas calceolata TaxID=35677 RepID=A0A8J2WSG4_9STRA|nr:unnamed protein product [Pelagomonas calceolata]
MAAPSTDLLKSFGAELLAALPRTDEPAAPQAMRRASEELEVARTLSACGDLAGAEETLLAVAGAARARAAETLSTRELYTVIRASAGLAEVSVARDDWAAAEDAVKLALAASEALAPEIANRELALVAKPLAVAAVGSGHTEGAKALSPNVRRALSVGAAKPPPRTWPLRDKPTAVARVASFLAVRDAARFSVCAKATASAVDVATRRDLRRVHGEATPPRRRAAGASDDCCVCFDALGDKATILRCGHALHTSCLAAWRRRGGDTCPLCKAPAARRSRVSDALLRSPSDEGAAAAIKRALRRVATARQAAWHLARDAGSAAFCARVNPSRSVDEIVDAMVVFGPPGLRAKAARDIGLSDATSVEIGNVLDTTHVNGPLRVNVVATAPARGRQAWTVHVVAAPPPDARRAHLAVGLGLDKTRRVEHFSVISRSADGQVRRGALLRQTSWVLRFRAGKHPLLCAENGDASVDGRDAFRFATAGKDAATVCAGDRIDLFADLGAQTLRVRHGSRVYEVSLRRFGFDTGRLRPVVEVRNGQRSEGAGDPLRQTASLKARIAANPWDGWRLRVEPTTSIPPDLFAPKEVLTF